MGSASINRARQLLRFADALGGYRSQAISRAIADLSSTGSEPTRLRDQLYVMLATLPTQVAEQADELLGGAFDSYRVQVNKVIEHWQQHSTSQPCNQLVGIFTEPNRLAVQAIADLVDFRMAVGGVDEDRRSALQDTVAALIAEINEDKELDPDVKRWLLEVAVHLRQIVEQYDLFGPEAARDLQGRFITDLIYEHPDLFPEYQEKDPPAERRYVRRLLHGMGVAATLIGLPLDAIEAGSHVAELIQGL